MINFFEFRFLPDEEQSDYIIKQGKFLCTLNLPEHKIGLYHLFDFYVEVYYYKPNRQIVKVKSFRSLEYLDPYLEQITLDELKSIIDKPGK